MARELSHASTMSFALSYAAWFHQRRGETQAVQARVEEGVMLATEQGFSPRQAQANFLQGWIFAEQGEWELGIARMFQVLATERSRTNFGRWISHGAALLADTCGKSRQTVEGLNVVTDALATVHATQCRYYEAELHRIKGELLLKQTAADEQQVEACFQNAIKIARGQSAKSLELRAAMSLSRLWQRQGKQQDAQKLLAEIYGWFTEGFDTADLKEAKALLKELS